MRKPHKKTSGIYEARIRLNPASPIIYRSLGTRNRAVAQKRLDALNKQFEEESCGLAVPLKLKTAANTSVSKLLIAFLSDYEKTCSSGKHVESAEYRLKKIIRDCGWRQLKDIRASDFQEWRARQPLRPKTFNNYLSALNVFLCWLVDRGELIESPLSKVKRSADCVEPSFTKRALTVEEASALIACSGKRRVFYATAIYTGLRCRELRLLEWRDLTLEDEMQLVRVRASSAKNRREARLPLHPDAVTLLRQHKPASALGTDRVFVLPSRKTFLNDLAAAGIPVTDDQRKKVTLHSLRYTTATWLACTQTPMRVTQEIMRHLDPRMTANVYTDPALLCVRDAVESMPSLLPVVGLRRPESPQALVPQAPILSTRKMVRPPGVNEDFSKNDGAPQIAPQKTDAYRVLLTGTDADDGSRKALENMVFDAVCRVLTGTGKKGEVAEREGFEPPEPCGSPVFKTGALNRSATSPSEREIYGDC